MQIEAKDFAVTRRLIKEASELGLTSIDIPEEYGGLEMDKVTSAIVADNIAQAGQLLGRVLRAHVASARCRSSGTAHAEQKKKYLPKLASGEFIGAYALSESTSGSDAVNANTRAVLSEDGKSYTLNGEKMWISNAGFADLFTVFAKCAVPDGPRMQAKKSSPPFWSSAARPASPSGKEEHKLGIRGSSTCPLILTDCKIPARICWARSARASHRLQHPERWPVQAGQCRRRRRAHGARQRHPLCERAQGVRQIHLRVRADPGEARRTAPSASLSAKRSAIAPSG